MARLPSGRLPAEPDDDFAAFQQPREDDDFGQRMRANGAALIVTLLLLAAGIWLAFNLTALRKTQDCVLAGRRDCAPITKTAL